MGYGSCPEKFVHEEPLDKNIVVLSMGGVGHCALNRIIDHNIEGISCIAIDTDEATLQQSKAQRKVLVEKSDLDFLPLDQAIDWEKTAILFLIAGIDEHTRTLPLLDIAGRSRGHGILTLGIFFAPLTSEAPECPQMAHETLENIKENLDALMILEFNKLSDMNENGQITDVLSWQFVQSITELLTRGGYINLNIDDVTKVFFNAGNVVVGVGLGKGERSVEDAARGALKSPFIPESLKGFTRVLIRISTGDDITLGEMARATESIRWEVSPDTAISWGHVIDMSLQHSALVTLMATEGRKAMQGEV